jgi:hypothetical protein
MKKIFAFIIISLAILPVTVFSQANPEATVPTPGIFDKGFIKSFSQSAGIQTPGNPDINNEIAFFINISLGFVGIILLVLTLIAGTKWMTAQGDKDKIASAKNIIIGCTIGLFLLTISYSASNFVITSINNAQGNKFNKTTQINNGEIGIEPGELSQTICEFNSQCPIAAPFCTNEDWYTVNLGYCNCCDNETPGYECNVPGNRNNYCAESFGSQGIYNAICKDIENVVNSACVITCTADNQCPSGQFCNTEFITPNEPGYCKTL